MNRRTWTIIGLTAVLLGLGVLALGLVEQDARVRQVGHVLAEPATYSDGTWTLVGLPHAPQVPVDGGARMVPNEAFTNTTRHTSLWTLDGRPVQSTVEVRVDFTANGTAWNVTNTTRAPGDPTILAEDTWTATLDGAWTVFQVEGFDVDGAGHARVWAVYQGHLKEPLQPKPSQFDGRLVASLPDGTPLPAGAPLYGVDELTVGCSSKFLPPEYGEDA